MNFTAFDTSKIEEYARRAKEIWGGTEAYREYEAKSIGKSTDEMADTGAQLMEIVAAFGAMQHLPATDKHVQRQVKALQDFITAHYYTCSKDILAQLGEMYATDGKFTENIDRAGGEGTARFAAEAIRLYCKEP